MFFQRVIFLSLLGAFILSACAGARVEQRQTSAVLGRPFDAETLVQSGDAAKKTLRFDPAALQQPALLVFWASWCTSCRYEVGDLIGLHEKYGKNLEVLGVNVDQEKKKGEHFLEEFKIPYVNVYDSDLKIADKYGVNATPTLILIDRKGEIRFKGHHLDQDFRRSLEKLLNKAA